LALPILAQKLQTFAANVAVLVYVSLVFWSFACFCLANLCKVLVVIFLYLPALK
jgi:hypothetical protein